RRLARPKDTVTEPRGLREDESGTRPALAGPGPKGEPMADIVPPTRSGGLTQFDLPLVFRCAVELAEAAPSRSQAAWGDLPSDIEGPHSPHFRRWTERHERLRRIGEESERLKRSLGALGPLRYSEAVGGDSPVWGDYDRRCRETAHDRVVRLALEKLA